LRAYRKNLEDFRDFLEVTSLKEASQFLVSQSHGQANPLALNFKAHLKNRRLSSTSVNRKLAGLRSLMKLGNTSGLISWKLEVPYENTEPYRDTRGPGEEAFRSMLKIAGESQNKIKTIRDVAILRLWHDLALRRCLWLI